MRRTLLFMLGMLLISAQLLAQNRTVTGKITDDKGNAVPNASVIIKGTNLGTTTGADGTFSISVPANARALIVSFVGMGEKEIALGTGNNYNVSLSTQSKNDKKPTKAHPVKDTKKEANRVSLFLYIYFL